MQTELLLEAACSTPPPESPNGASPAGRWQKMCPDFSVHARAGTLAQWLESWLGASLVFQPMDGETPVLRSAQKGLSNGQFWMRNGSTSRSGGSVCSLSEILETGPVDRRFYLSQKACAGILRRAAKRGKELPPQLKRALEQVAQGGGQTSCPGGGLAVDHEAIASPLLSGGDPEASHNSRSGRSRDSHIVPVPIAFQERGREGGRNLEMQEGLAYSLNSPKGGGRSNENNVAVPIGIAGGELGYALRASASHSGDKGDGGVNTTLIAFPQNLSSTQCAKAEDIAPAMGSKNPTAIAFTQNSRDEVRENGGNVAGALAAEPGAKQQTYVAIQINMQAAGKNGERSPNMLGIGQDGDPAPTLGASDRHAVAHGVNEDVAAPLTAGMAASAARMPHEQGCLVPEVSPTLRAGGNKTGGHRPPGTDVDTCETLITETGGALPEIAWALQERDAKGPDSSTKEGHLIPTPQGGFFNAMAVRRLTVMECEILQGFPPGYTQVPFRGKPAADGPRYRAIGNSFAVPVVKWIGRQIERASLQKDSAK